MSVFSSYNESPRSFRNSLIMFFTPKSISGESPVTMKSSAYRTKFILCLLYLTAMDPFLLDQYLDFILFSKPSNVIFASVGDTIPSYAVPIVVGNRFFSMYPLFKNFLNMFFQKEYYQSTIDG